MAVWVRATNYSSQYSTPTQLFTEDWRFGRTTWPSQRQMWRESSKCLQKLWGSKPHRFRSLFEQVDVGASGYASCKPSKGKHVLIVCLETHITSTKQVPQCPKGAGTTCVQCLLSTGAVNVLFLTLPLWVLSVQVLTCFHYHYPVPNSGFRLPFWFLSLPASGVPSCLTGAAFKHCQHGDTKCESDVSRYCRQWHHEAQGGLTGWTV